MVYSIERRCLYDIDAVSSRMKIDLLQAWFDQKQGHTNEIKVFESNSQESYGAGALNGGRIQIDLRTFNRISAIEVYLSKGHFVRFYGIVVVGSDVDGRRLSAAAAAAGRQQGIKYVYHTRIPTSSTTPRTVLSGLFGMYERGIPSAIGFVLTTV